MRRLVEQIAQRHDYDAAWQGTDADLTSHTRISSTGAPPQCAALIVEPHGHPLGNLLIAEPLKRVANRHYRPNAVVVAAALRRQLADGVVTRDPLDQAT
jgi:hypothetical protein